jgi:hypothetical protein
MYLHYISFCFPEICKRISSLKNRPIESYYTFASFTLTHIYGMFSFWIVQIGCATMA